MKLKDAIERECKKLISRFHHSYAMRRSLSKKFTRRTGVESMPAAQRTPISWEVAPWFNPFKVRRRANQVATAIEAKIERGTYSPMPALIAELEKPSGGVRPISIFPVADAAVASAYFRTILKRNQSRYSPFSYAYRRDLSAHDAIEMLWRESSFATHHFLVEFDFSKYFDTIRHDYLESVLRKYFKLTRSERRVVASILHARRAFSAEDYRVGRFRPNSRGLPQGNSMSLFLANAACHELDLELTRSGALFARYADDIVVLSRSRNLAGEARERILAHCGRTGLSVNFEKSLGITELGPQGLREGSAVRTHFEFLGHRFQYRAVAKRGTPAQSVVRRLAIRPVTEARIRSKLGQIIYSHLLRYPTQGLFKETRVDSDSGIDWDLVTCINDLRGYLYGGLPEDEIRAAIGDRNLQVHRARGTMSFFPLINDVEQLRRLDGWMLHSVYAALRSRQRVLQEKLGVSSYPYLSKRRLLTADWYSIEEGPLQYNDVRLPSFVRAWKYGRRCLNAIGLSEFPTRAVKADEQDLYD